MYCSFSQYSFFKKKIKIILKKIEEQKFILKKNVFYLKTNNTDATKKKNTN
jgi:hypothetical protein